MKRWARLILAEKRWSAPGYRPLPESTAPSAPVSGEAATPIRDFAEDGEGAPFNGEMTARVAHDSTRLYLSLIREVPDTTFSAVQVGHRIEWAFSLSREPGVAYVFGVTPSGVLQERKGGDPAWNPGLERGLPAGTGPVDGGM